MSRRFAVVSLALAFAACAGSSSQSSNGATGGTGSGTTSSSGSTGSSGSSGATGDTGTTVTFWGDVAPIVQQHCIQCHQPGGIAPFSLETYEDAKPQAMFMSIVVQPDQAPLYGYNQMPPWPPGPGCNSYTNEQSHKLSDTEINTIVQWVATGAKEGPAHAPLEPDDAGPALSHVDMTLSMPQSYLPTLSPDDYHCFLLDWPETATKFVTGFNVHPGDPAIVHHVIAYIVAPGDVSKYQGLESPDSGVPGWTCFGGAGADDSAQWLAAWAPGANQGDFPATTGIQVDPGSKIILQLHYNTLNGPGEMDLTHVDIETADSVQTKAVILPFANYRWLSGGMPIAAGDPDAGALYAVDASPYMSYVTNGIIQDNVPFKVWTAAAHMHLRGKREHLGIDRADGGETCLLEVPHWSFHWQGSYELAQPETVNPGDQLELDCHWDNSAGNQPYVNGVQEVPKNLNWGEGTDDEMCLGLLYATP